MKLRVDGCRLLPGCAGGLTERTALVDLTVTGAPDSDDVDGRIHAAATSFCTDQHLYDVRDSEWPGSFVMDPAPHPDDAPVRRLGEWVVALTVAAQRWGHDPVWRGRVLEAGPDRLRLAVPWHRDEVFHDALDMAVRLVGLWARPQPDRSALRRIDRDFRARLPGVQAGGLNVDSLRFVECAARKGIPYQVSGGAVRFGWGANAQLLDGAVTGDTGVLAAALARNKPRANRRLAEAGVPVPRCRVVSSPAQARAAAAELGWPVVVKPPGLDSGNGVAPGIRDHARLERAATAAARMGGGTVMVEEHVEGLCYRLLIVHGELLAAVRRVPAGVRGDGVRTVAELVAEANTDPRRVRQLCQIVLDSPAVEYLREQRLRPDSVPAAGRQVWLRRTAYTETGGHHEDVTAVVHPDNRALAQRVARLMGLDIAGIDLLTTDVTRSWREVGGAVCEVNAQPSLMPHWIAQPDRDINGEVLDILFAGRPARIPTAAFTGVGPVGDAAVLLHRIWQAAGQVAGLCTAEQVRFGAEAFAAADFPGLAGIRAVLAEPTVTAAVLELPAADLGHGCDRYDVVAVLGDDPAACADALARAASAVVLGVDGADAPAAPGVRRILVADGPVPGAAAVYPGDGAIVLPDGARIPTTEAGDAALFAAAAAWAHGIDAAVIGAALASLDLSAC